MYKEHPDFKTPDDKTPIWRYLNFSKLVSLLEYSSLFFPSVLKLAEDDPYEGSYARGNIDYDPMGDPVLKAAGPQVIASIQKMREESRKFVKEKCRKIFYVNSWYINEHDSAAMWKCYAEHEDGIAIQSTVGKLKEAVKDFSEEIYISRISYIDYETSIISEGDLFSNFLCKRKSFEHERELRAVLANFKLVESDTILPGGVAVPVDVKTLIEKILISPTASSWVKDLVETIAIKYGLGRIVKKSSLREGGLW